MIKFKNGALSGIIDAMSTTGALIKADPKTMQAILNSAQKSKEFSRDIYVHSTTDGLILARNSDVNVKKPTEFLQDTLVEFSEALTPDLHHKTTDAKAEFRYYPALRQMMRVRSRNDDAVVLVDDDHNIFRVTPSMHYISAKVSVIPVFFPKLITERKEADAFITASNIVRGMDNIKVGDTVVVREYIDMVNEFGKNTISFGYEDDQMDVTCEIKGANTLLYTAHAKYLGGRKMVISKILEDRQEIIMKEPQTKLINPTTGEEVSNLDPIRFSRLHFIKA